MRKEKIEQDLRDISDKLLKIKEKYADKKKVLDEAYAADIKVLQEKEKLLKRKLKEMETAEKMKLVSKISFEDLREFSEKLEKDRSFLEKKRALVGQREEKNENE